MAGKAVISPSVRMPASNLLAALSADFTIREIGAHPRSASRVDQSGLRGPEDKDPGIETGPMVADQSAPHRAGSVVA